MRFGATGSEERENKRYNARRWNVSSRPTWEGKVARRGKVKVDDGHVSGGSPKKTVMWGPPAWTGKQEEKGKKLQARKEKKKRKEIRGNNNEKKMRETRWENCTKSCNR